MEEQVASGFRLAHHVAVHPCQRLIIGFSGGSAQRLAPVVRQVLEQLRYEGDAGEQPVQVASAAVLHANPAGLRA